RRPDPAGPRPRRLPPRGNCRATRVTPAYFCAVPTDDHYFVRAFPGKRHVETVQAPEGPPAPPLPALRRGPCCRVGMSRAAADHGPPRGRAPRGRPHPRARRVGPGRGRVGAGRGVRPALPAGARWPSTLDLGIHVPRGSRGLPTRLEPAGEP